MTHSIGLGTRNIFDACQALEMSCAELYHYFAELYKDDRDSLLLWLKTAMEEENHSRQFALVAKLQNKNIIDCIQIELIAVEVSLLYVRALIDRVKNHPPSQKEALRIAIDLEKKLDCFRIENVVVFADDSYDRSFQAISNADFKHLESLQEAYERAIST